MRRIGLIAALVAIAVGMSALAGTAAAAERTVCDSGCDFTAIQPAVDAADPGDRVTIGPGTYVEQLTVAKPLSIEGSGPDTIIRSPASPDALFDSGDIAPVVYVSADGVDIAALVVDGDLRSSGTAAIAGIGFENADGRVDQVEVTGTRSDAADSGGVGIVSSGGSVVVRRATVTGYETAGIQLRDAAAAAIERTEVDEPGPAPSGGQTGVVLDGIGDVDIEESNISGNDVGIDIKPGSAAGTAADVHLSRLTGNGTALRNATSVTVDAEHDWFGCNAGPGASGCSPVENTGAGAIDFDPWVVLSLAPAATQTAVGTELAVDGALRFDSEGDCVSGDWFHGICWQLAFPGSPPPKLGATLGGLTADRNLGYLSFIAGNLPGTATLSASFDGETVTDQVEVVPRQPPPFTIDSVKRDRGAGTARLLVAIGESGTLTLRGAGLHTRTVETGSGGEFELVARARGAAAERLTRRGRVKVHVAVTWVTRFDERLTRERDVVLVRRG